MLKKEAAHFTDGSIQKQLLHDARVYQDAILPQILNDAHNAQCMSFLQWWLNKIFDFFYSSCVIQDHLTGFSYQKWVQGGKPTKRGFPAAIQGCH